MRGKPLIQLAENPGAGITPADAGKTYKRSRKIFCKTGSPPQMRGKPTRIFVCAYHTGITPADAGKTQQQTDR